jgi:thymidylate synthase
MNTLDLVYQDLLSAILTSGVEKKDRTGTGTKSLFGYQIRHDMQSGFPLLTTKKMAWKQIVTELLWFLRGDTNIKYLVDNNCHIWDGDAYKNYVKAAEMEFSTVDFGVMTKEEFINKIKTGDGFAKKWGDLGPVYGRQWRSWGGKNTTLVDVGGVSKKDLDKVIEAAKNKEDVSRYGAHIKQQNNSIDQIANLIHDLKTNPDSRRLMVNAWNVGEIDQMVLPPCHYGFQVYTRELSDEERLDWMKKNRPKTVLPMRDPSVEFSMDEFFRPYGVPKRAISLMWNQRSVDTFLGLPFNIASYGLLLEIIAKEVNMVPDELIGNLGDVHLYNNHIEQAELLLTREPYKLPKLNINTEWWDKPFYEAVKSDAFCKCLLEEDIQLYDYQSHPTIKAPLSN